MKIAIVGYGGCGKDHAANFLHCHTSFEYRGSTSWAALPMMARHFGVCEQVAWDTRRDNRDKWKHHLRFLKANNVLLLVERLEEVGATVITGLRDLEEVRAAKKVGWQICWIDAAGRGIGIDTTVDTGIRALADHEWGNHGTMQQFNERLRTWATNLHQWTAFGQPTYTNGPTP